MSKKANNFKRAIEETPDVRTCYKSGLSALGVYSNKIELSDTRFCDGSVDIDSCVTKKYPNANRWDYCFSYRSKVYFVEVHTANTGEVDAVLKKLQWLKDWLNHEAPQINALKAPISCYWIQSGRYNILPTSRQAKQAAAAGVKPIPKLRLT
jgi:hypothetical protein